MLTEPENFVYARSQEVPLIKGMELRIWQSLLSFRPRLASLSQKN